MIITSTNGMSNAISIATIPAIIANNTTIGIIISTIITINMVATNTAATAITSITAIIVTTDIISPHCHQISNITTTICIATITRTIAIAIVITTS